MTIWGDDGVEERDSLDFTPPGWLVILALLVLVAAGIHAVDHPSTWPESYPRHAVVARGGR